MPQQASSTPPGDSERAPRRATRRAGVRGALAFVFACCGMAGVGGFASPALAQESGGQIFIPGPGDHSNGAEAASMSALIAAPTPRPSPAAVFAPTPAPARTSEARAAEAEGMITIPGAGERGAQVGNNAGNNVGNNAASAVNASASGVNIVTIPAPGAVPNANAAPNNRYRANANPPVPARAATLAAASRVATVVVEASASASAPRGAVQPQAQAQAQAQAPAAQAPVPAGQQDGEQVRAAALAYLQQQSAGLPGKVAITVAPVFPRGLAACTSLQPFMPVGARTWGQTTVGVRCFGERPWTLYVQARVAVQITYYVAARPITPGDSLAAIDLQPRDGDLANLPQTVITDPSQALNAVALVRIPPGLPLRTDMLRSAASVVIGQTVRLEAAGSNFTISTEGSVLNNAAPGQMVRVRTAGGQIINGVVKDAATVEVQI